MLRGFMMGKKKETKTSSKEKSKAVAAVKTPPKPKKTLLGRKKKLNSTKALLPEQIQQRAYLIWESEGCPHGKDEQHWKQAEQELTQN